MRNAEQQRFTDAIRMVNKSGKLKLVISESTVMDAVHPWLKQMKDVDVPLTTFSVAMMNYMTGGMLHNFVEGIKKFEKLQEGNKVLVSSELKICDYLEDMRGVQS